VTDGRRSDAALADLVRDQAGLIAASLSRRLGDFDLAEEAVQDAIVTALRVWRRDGVPVNPGGWLNLTARRNAIDRLRRRARGERAALALADEPAPRPAAPGADDVRNPMLFACCHPSLAQEARLALTLRAVVGLTTPQIARAFLVAEATVAQRIVRAKRKIVDAGIPLRVPDVTTFAARLDDVLTVTYITYNAGYLVPRAGDERDLAADAVWLAELLVGQLPDEPEAAGLLALLLLLESRAGARFAADGTLIPLGEQDRTRWDRSRIAAAETLIARAAWSRRPGRFQLQAALAACHAQALRAEETDWLQILTLYDLLLQFDSSPVVRLNRAIALAEVAGVSAALEEVESLTERLRDYHLLHATRAKLLAELGRQDEARAANLVALRLAPNAAEQALLRERIGLNA
jgi:RNA polymerase sigma-70 factor (ECF subfamily)